MFAKWSGNLVNCYITVLHEKRDQVIQDNTKIEAND